MTKYKVKNPVSPLYSLTLFVSSMISRLINFKRQNGVRILMYHRITTTESDDQRIVNPDIFEEQMKYISDKYQVVDLERSIKLLKEGADGFYVVITFDDGYKDNIDNAIPILKRYKVPATIFVTARYATQDLKNPNFQTEVYLHFTWDDAIQLPNSISIGSHTLSHPNLQKINYQECKKEIMDSKKEIEEATNLPVKFFCYPSGAYGKREIGIIKKARYVGAVTVSPGINTKRTSLFKLKRTGMTNKDVPYLIERKLKGDFDFIHILFNIKRRWNLNRLKYKRQ